MKPLYISVDVEADGPSPGLFSLISLGAVVIDEALDKRFYAEMAPLDGAQHDPEAAAVGGFTLDKQWRRPLPQHQMVAFDCWLDNVTPLEHRPAFVSDNAGFDWAYVNYYLHKFVGHNRFGHSSFSLTSAYKGFARDARANFRKDGLRTRRHSHNALDDALGNAEAFLELVKRGYKS